MPPHHALRKYQGPGVWAHVKADYLAGEPGRVVAERYDVSLANLRRRASDEGWTRAAHAQATDRPAPGAAPPGSPPLLPAQASPEAELSGEAALEAALAQARRQLVQGRGAEAAATLKAAEALRRLQADLDAAAGAPDPWEAQPPPALSQLPAEVRVAGHEGLRAEIEARADTLARALLGVDAAMSTPALHTAFVLHWRARHLGAEAAAADHATAVRCGWAARAYDAQGGLLPLGDLLAKARRGFASGPFDEAVLPPVDAEPAWLAPIGAG